MVEVLDDADTDLFRDENILFSYWLLLFGVVG